MSAVPSEDDHAGAETVRREVLGDAYVDAQTAEDDPVMQQFQAFVTETAWGTWAREGALTRRDRSLLVLAMTATLGRMDELKVHARSRVRTGVTDAELDELLFMVTAYCGVPAGVAAKRAVAEVRAEPATDA